MLWNQYSFRFAYIVTNIISLSFLHLCASIWDHISSAWRRIFNISFSLSLLVTNVLSIFYVNVTMKCMSFLQECFSLKHTLSPMNIVIRTWYHITFGDFTTKIFSNTMSALFPLLFTRTQIKHGLDIFTTSSLILSPSH